MRLRSRFVLGIINLVIYLAVFIMFSALSKVASFFLTNEDEDEGEEDSTDNNETNQQNLYKDVTQRAAISQIKGQDKVIELGGKVTHLFNNHGLIDNELYFSFDSVVGGTKPKLGDPVNIVANQKISTGSLNVVKVSVSSSEWDEDHQQIHHEFHGDETRGSGCEAIVGMVTSFNGCDGFINENIPFSVSDVETDFVPSRGDYVTTEVKNDEQNQKQAQKIKPLRKCEKEGTVTASQGNHGYIDSEIFFSLNVNCHGYRPNKWDRVEYVAIESIQGKCNWRAISVKPAKFKASSSMNLLTNPIRSSFLEDLQKDKNGITVSVKTDFGNVEIGDRKKITIWVRNQGSTVQIFRRCHLTAQNSQFEIDSVMLLKEHSTMRKQGNEDVKGRVVNLHPGMCIYINVSCNGSSVGSEEQLLVLTFDQFRIGRYLKANVVHPYQSLVDSGTAYSRQNRYGYSRYKNSSKSANGYLIPGEKPNKFGSRLHLPNRLPHYNVPETLRDCILEYRDELEVNFPELTQELNMKNYVKRFHTLLHLEEIQMDIDIREFDLDRVCLRPVGEFLALKVPGLAEGRPSVLIGDKVMLSDPGNIDGPVYEGFVHELMCNEVLIKFNKDFHNTYTGKDFNVIFTFNRAPVRRCHQAAEFAVNLGENVLFPKALLPKLSRTLDWKEKVEPDIRPVSGINQKLFQSVQFFNPTLNDRQKSAVHRILQGQSRPLPYVLFGPPGTGKTITLVETMLQVLTKIPSSRILACTPSNSAADLIVERLHLSGLVKTSDMVRLNALQRDTENLSENVKPYCSVGEDLVLTSHYRIIVCTCVTAGLLYSLGMQAGHFSHVFIDEAGQATEPECLISACMVAGSDGQIILAGDPMQLGPVLTSRYAKKYGLELSYLERLTKTPLYERNELMFSDHGCYDPLLVTKLVNNYRSHSSILSIYSKLFYDNELIVNADPKLTHTLTDWDMLPKKGFPVIFHGVRGEDLREGNSPSWFNPAETVQVIRYLQGLLQDKTLKLTPDDIGIITPYRKQVEKIRLLIDKLGIDMVKVGSVEEFQGQERQVIIISTVRSNEKYVGFDKRHTLGFLSNPKRFNVSISRAQALMIIVGNPYVLSQDAYWQVLIQYCRDNGGYTGCDIPDLDVISHSG